MLFAISDLHYPTALGKQYNNSKYPGIGLIQKHEGRRSVCGLFKARMIYTGVIHWRFIGENTECLTEDIWPEIVCGCIGQSLELGSRRVSFSIPKDVVPLLEGLHRDYCYVVDDEEFEVFSWSVFEGLKMKEKSRKRFSYLSTPQTKESLKKTLDSYRAIQYKGELVSTRVSDEVKKFRAWRRPNKKVNLE